MNKKRSFLIILFSFLLLFSPLISGTLEKEKWVKKVIDFENLKKIKKITTRYLIKGSSKEAIEIITYYLNHNNKKNFIDIIENAEGTFCKSFYETSFNFNLIEGFTQTTYFSEPENREYREIYLYENGFLKYREYYKNKAKTFSLNNFSGDSIRLMELLTFAKLNDLKKIEAKGFIVPGALKIPFVFKFLKEEKISINNKTYNCLLYSGEINGILNAPAKIIFGSSKIWLLKEFPHIRIKADYFNKNFTLIDYKIFY